MIIIRLQSKLKQSFQTYNRIVMQPKKPDRFNKIQKLGEGTYGVVYKAEYTEQFKKPGQDQYIALKKIRLQSQQQGIPSTAIRQISILKQLNHPNIVQLKQVIHSNKKLLLVFQYVEYDLKKFMSQINRQKGMDPLIVKSFCYQLLQGINYCHEKKILHRDLKPQNLLISKDHILKIADFGLARASGIPTKGFTHQVVTLWYRPPDVLLGSQKYSNNIDIWSVGCIFAEMSNMKALFPGQKQQDQLIRIFKVVGTPTVQTWPGHEDLPHWKNYQFQFYAPKNLSQIVPKLDELGIDLLKKMLQPNPFTRISAKEALIHPYFKDLPEQVLNLYKKI